jgi:hypothetical protein
MNFPHKIKSHIWESVSIKQTIICPFNQNALLSC